MKLDIDITPEQYRIVKDIINRFLPNTCKVWVFGSRAKDTAQDYSDLDLALDAGKEVDYDTIRQLKLAFEESRLPYTVDVVDLHSVEPYFKEIIDSQKVVFPLNRSLSDRDSDCIEGKRNVPQLRFPGFAEPWVEKRLGEVGKVAMCKRVLKHETLPSGEIPFFKIGTFGKVPDAYITSSLYKDYKEKYSHPKKGEVLISASGTIGRTVVYDGNPAYFQDSNIVWIDNDERIALNIFLLFCYKKIRWNTEDTTIARLYNDNLKNIKFHLPSLPEQQKIANFLTEVDNKIQSLTQKKDALTQYKKGLLQKMFPSSKKGGFDTSTSSARALSHRASTSARSLSDRDSDCIEGNIPELRFPGFSTSTGSATEWVEKRLGEVADVRDGTHDSPKFHQDGFPLITSKNLLKNGLIDFDNISYISEQDFKQINKRSKVDIGDILFGMIGTIGNPVQLKQDGFAIKNVALIKEQNKLLNVFLIYYLYSNNIRKQFFIENVGGTQKFLPLGVIRNLKIITPSLPEQQKIADFLTTVDNKITQVDQQIEKTTQFKKGLLQQMFV